MWYHKALIDRTEDGEGVDVSQRTAQEASYEWDEAAIAALERRIDYRFRSRVHLEIALTHRSWIYEHREADEARDNERLEFLGDAVLGLAIAEALYHEHPELPEGRLSRLRAAVVCEATLAAVAAQIGLGPLLRLGHGEALSQGASKPSNLSNAFEALLAAILLDASIEEAARVARRLLARPLQRAVAGRLVYDYKSRLLEWRQADPGRAALSFDLESTEGPVHDPVFTVVIRQDGQALGRGTGQTKKAAEQAAAARVLEEFGLVDALAEATRTPDEGGTADL